MKFAVLDLETTGHQTDDEIIQVGLVLLDAELNVTETFSSYVKPNVAIPSFITQLTGISEQTVEDAPPLEEVLLGVIPLLNDAVLVAHNVGFDAGFLNQSLDRCGYMPFVGRKLDTIDLLRILYPSLTTYQLGAVSELFGIEHDRHHQADSDAMATAILFGKAVSKLRDLPLLTLQRLAVIFKDQDDLGWFMEQSLMRKETETAVDTDAFAYFRQFALKVGDWTEEMPPRSDDFSGEVIEELDFDTFMEQVRASFRERVLNYEERDAQNQMFKEVYDALNNDRHLLIEAGTGTGKSLGYLIPSLFYGVQQEKKIVVSTHTINLQEQLRERDIPLLQSTMPFPFRAAVFKGRGNYLCLRKFEGKINLQDFVTPTEDRITAAQMIIWLGETENGDQEELHFGNRGADFWDTVSSDADSCLNRACPWFKRCYYHRAKQEANLADVVITNHSMLFTDIRADHRLLPPYEQLIVDEAHHLEEVAGKHLGMQLSYYTLLQPHQRLCKDARSGLLPQLRTRLQHEDHEYSESWVETIDTLIPQFSDIKESWDKLFELLYQMSGNASSNESGENVQAVARLKAESLPDGWKDAETEEANVFAELGRIVKSLDKLLTDVKDRIDDGAIQALVTDMNGSVKDLARVKDDLRFFIKVEERMTVYWIEANPNFRSKSVHLYAVPADVSSQLQQYFFETKKSITLTSATLSVQKSFQYAIEQFGLEAQEQQGRLKTVQLPSPFNYREQALVVIPRNFPSVKGTAGDPQFIGALVQSLAEAAQETQGRMLILFTAYRMLKQVYEPLKEALAHTNIQVLGQGIDSGNRSKLTRRFQQHQASVLLGTSSFWEGVDIPGEALVCLAIVRLPFQPPNHPLVEAKAEMLQQQKQNPFMKLSIPQAVIRFKQGFGRLVRSSQDRGIVLIYDTRVIETYYGKYFLYSLPGPKIEHMHLEQIVPRMREWLDADQKEAEA
ncbi:ATP-dependent DNA helicase DinG [Paenibacillus abyssi]|uniref:3'-5' exonuclease DinG n=1 Tax=Paenibacillus abyssi TaxID=1340531 RepID=A0A917FM39_9BACL|nr:ATP-dependent DNA helicase DinG [Paenibacillus abyssi]GGF89094.1 ATP-dependent helicase DinG [Paenibacillus abyssi]